MSNSENSRSELASADWKILFWASFLALVAAGFGFVFRVMLPNIWGQEFQITAQEVGSITGAALWPIAVTMILFSLLVDRIGYKTSMIIACTLQTLSVVFTFLARDTTMLWWACFFAGLGHGVVEAVINPLCATVYRDEKSKMLNILHAAWPAGLALGGTIYLLINPAPDQWRWVFWVMMVPVVAYGVMFALCHHYPVDERVEANVSMREMLGEFGGLGGFLAITFLFYELASQVAHYFGFVISHLLAISLVVGALGGALFGRIVGSAGKPLFFILCLIMIPLATAELATDHWIRTLMEPVLRNAYSVDAGWAIVASAGIMMVLRFFAGSFLRFMSPPALLLFSSIFSMIGLYLLSGATGSMIFLAFVFYAVGQTFYWPTMLGFVSERFPRGGAMTLNTVAAVGLLTVGIFGFPFLGSVKDNFDAQTVQAEHPALFDEYKIPDQRFFFWTYDSIRAVEVLEHPMLGEAARTGLQEQIGHSGRKTLKVAAVLPLIMAVSFAAILLWFKARGGYRSLQIRED